MIGWLTLVIWALAASMLHLRGQRRLVAAARARHEVRGPLCTARLALEGLERSARVDAIELELRRAALALDDLAGVGREPSGAVSRSVRAVVARAPWPVRAAVAPITGRRRSIRARRSRSRRRGVRAGRVDLGRLLVESTHAWQALADAHGVRLAVEPAPALVAGDHLRLAQACSNLVANAIEHGGGHVRIASSASAGRVRVEVADLGPGLPAPVSTLVAAARGRRSVRGHGLAIAAAIADCHGGALTAQPVARGAHLVLELPEAAPDLPHARPGLAVSSSSTVSEPAPIVSRPFRTDS